jgi:quinol monooxygenase YgiN
MGGIEGQVAWLTQCAVKEGQLEAFKALMDEMVAATRDEPGTLDYEWFISDDDSTVHIYERFADSDATIAHANSFLEQWVQRYMGCVEVKGFTVYGNPSDAARQAIAPFGGKQLGRWGGFARD